MLNSKTKYSSSSKFFFLKMDIPELDVLGVKNLRDIVSSYLWNDCCVSYPARTLSSLKLNDCQICRTPVCQECALGCEKCKRCCMCADCMFLMSKCIMCKCIMCVKCVWESYGHNWCFDCLPKHGVKK